MILFRLFFLLTILGLFTLLILGIISSQRRSSSRKKKPYFIVDEKLRGILDQLTENIIPIDIHELKILGWAKKVIKKTRQYESGYLSTIFQEHLISYLLTYSKGGKKYLIANSSQGAYHFLYKGHKTMVIEAGQEIGEINEQLTYSLKDGSDEYHVIPSDGQQGIIKKGERELASYNLGPIGQKIAISDRYFNYVNSVNDDEMRHLVALSIYLLLLNNKST